MRHTLMSLRSSQGDLTGNSGWGSAKCCRLWVHQNALRGESRLAPCRGWPGSCSAEARLLCSGACGVWGRGRSPSARPPSCPVLAPGIVPTFRFPWALSVLRSLRSDGLRYSGETSERREKEETRSAVLPHPHDQPQMYLSDLSGVWPGFWQRRLGPRWDPLPACSPGCALPAVFLWLCFQGTRPGIPWPPTARGPFPITIRPSGPRCPFNLHYEFSSFPPTARPVCCGFQSASCICDWGASSFKLLLSSEALLAFWNLVRWKSLRPQFTNYPVCCGC